MAKLLRVGHSGAAAYAPPNTLRSLELALKLGVDMVEFDLRRCRDALVLIHDKDLRSSTNGRGNVGDYTCAELQNLDAGDGERIPTLHEAVSLIKGRAQINVDLKEAGYEDEVLGVLRQHGVLVDVLISSLIPASVRRVKALASEVSAGISYPSDNPYKRLVVRLMAKLTPLPLTHRIPKIIAAAHADSIMMHHQIVSPQMVDSVHSAGYRIFAWTVDDLISMQRMKKLGIDAIISNRPDLFAQL